MIFDNEVQNRILTAKEVIGLYATDLNLEAKLKTCKPYYNANDKNDPLYSVPKRNRIVSYRPTVSIFPWRMQYASTIKTLNNIEFEYRADVGLGTTSITEQCWTFWKSGF